jgi:acyl-CoA synthetase (AMP-forming)/AMP-acid ligase II
VAFVRSLASRAARFATGLTDLGVRPGDRLVVLMANCPEVLITYSAAWRAGAVVTPLIFLVSEDELRAALVDSGVPALDFAQVEAAAPGSIADRSGPASPPCCTPAGRPAGPRACR